MSREKHRHESLEVAVLYKKLPELRCVHARKPSHLGMFDFSSRPFVMDDMIVSGPT